MKKIHIAMSVILLVLMGCNESSTDIVIPGKGKNDSSSVKYSCDNGEKIFVTYMNNDENSVAVMNMPDKQKLLLVNVISGSGSKYVGGEIEWWVKGDNASFLKSFNENNIECKEIK